MKPERFVVLRDSGEETPNGGKVLIGMPAEKWAKMSESRQDRCLDIATSDGNLRIYGGENIYAGEGPAKVALANGHCDCIPSTGKNGGYTIVISPKQASRPASGESDAESLAAEIATLRAAKADGSITEAQVARLKALSK